MSEIPTATAPTASCCEWRAGHLISAHANPGSPGPAQTIFWTKVREGLSLMAVVPRQMSSGTKWNLLSHGSENQCLKRWT